jgi:rsbT antagonist protein RsbS
MSDDIRDVPRVPIQSTHGCIVASLQVELRESVLRQFQSDLLSRIQSSQPSGVIFDISGLTLFDSHEFNVLRKTIDMARLMGRATVLVGMLPGLAASIAETDADCDQLLTARNLDEALLLIARYRH